MLRVAVPNKGSLSEAAAAILGEAGYANRTDSRELAVLDSVNQVEFFYLRPRDIALYVGSGEFDLGITGRDLAVDSNAPVRERLSLGFGNSTFRYAAPAGRQWTVADLAGQRIATSFPNLVQRDLDRHDIAAHVIRLDGAVEISIQLGVADVIADVVDSGRTLRQHGLVPFGAPLCESEAVLLESDNVPLSLDRDNDPLSLDRDNDPPAPKGDTAPKRHRSHDQLIERIQGVVFAQHYLMVDYDCPKDLLDRVVKITPGLESPTVSSLTDPDWVAVRALVPRKQSNAVMDELAEAGAKAILASDIRTCRALRR